jgi:hypothetical protein
VKNTEQLLWASGAILIALLVVWLAFRALRWAKKKTTAGSMLAAAAFPFPDQPPPHEQVEQANRSRQDSESGDPEQPSRP